MLDDWIWFGNFNMNRNVNFFDMWNMYIFNVRNWHRNFLDDSQSLFLFNWMMMMMVRIVG
jgi:hypothetical protein